MRSGLERHQVARLIRHDPPDIKENGASARDGDLEDDSHVRPESRLGIDEHGVVIWGRDFFAVTELIKTSVPRTVSTPLTRVPTLSVNHLIVKSNSPLVSIVNESQSQNGSSGKLRWSLSNSGFPYA